MRSDNCDWIFSLRNVMLLFLEFLDIYFWYFNFCCPHFRLFARVVTWICKMNACQACGTISKARYCALFPSRKAIIVPSVSLCYGQFCILPTLSSSFLALYHLRVILLPRTPVKPLIFFFLYEPEEETQRHDGIAIWSILRFRVPAL